MTRLAVLSDIHANLPALEAVIADMACFQPDHVVIAGDLINVGPFSAQVMKRVSELGWTAIRGNHEYYLLEYNTPRAPESRREWITLPLLYDQLKGRWYNTIAAMPDELTLLYPDAPPIRVMHGLPGNPWEALDRHSTDDEVRAALDGVAESTVISGHYHLSFDKQVDGWHVLNPGSLGAPLDGLQDAGYVILDSTPDSWQATFRRVPVDYTALFEEFERQRYVEQCGVVGYLIVQQFRSARTTVSAFRRWHQQQCPDEPASIPLVDQFLTTADIWDYTSDIYRYNRHLMA